MNPPSNQGSNEPDSADTLASTESRRPMLKGRYLLGPELGHGGFATTYLATDREVASRRVVVKFLNERHSGDSWSLGKFHSEMEALARIDHPNVVGVIDFGESADGRPFLVMQFVAGENLRAMVSEGGLPLPVGAEIFRQIGRGLTAAHDAGVVHRDIKPENIMIRKSKDGENQVRIIDFGIASVREADGHTSTMNISGTFSYMAPEQYEGKSSPASDIYQMGIVAYEMLTGSLPFRATNPGGVAIQQMSGLKVRPRELRPDLPEAADEAIVRALSPKPSDRFDRAREFGDALFTALMPGAQVSTGTGSSQRLRMSEPEVNVKPKRRRVLILAAAGLVAALALAAAGYYGLRPAMGVTDSLAVLPFENRTGDAGLDYLTQGITEALINDLSSIPTLRVSARGSVLKYEGQRQDARAAGRELGVRRVIDGSVSKRGDAFYVDTELLDVSTGSRIWGNAYSATQSSISEVLLQFSREVTDQLRLKFGGSLKERLKRQYGKGKSYEQYLKARFHLNKRTGSDFQEAIRNFEDVIATDPDYAPAHAGIADTYALMAAFGPFAGGAEPAFALERARTAAKRALQLDGTLAEAYNALAPVEMQADYEWQTAEQDFLRSIDLNPNFGETHENYGLELAGLGRFPAALREIELAEKLEPENFHFKSAHGLILYMGHRYDESLSMYRSVATTPERASFVADMMGLNYCMKSMPVQALDILELIPKNYPELRIPISIAAYARMGQAAKASELMAQNYLHPEKAWWYYLSVAHVSLRQPEAAIHDLERAYQERAFEVAWIGVEPMFDELRQQPAFRSLLEKTHLASRAH